MLSSPDGAASRRPGSRRPLRGPALQSYVSLAPLDVENAAEVPTGFAVNDGDLRSVRTKGEVSESRRHTPEAPDFARGKAEDG